MHGDNAQHSLREAILDAIRHELGDAIEIIKWPLLVPVLEGHQADVERLSFRKIQQWLRATSCDIAIWGSAKKNDVLSLRFTVPVFGNRLPETYKLTDELELPRKFIQTLGLAIAMRVCATEWIDRPRPDSVNYLAASVDRLQLIIQTDTFDNEVKAALIMTYGRALLTIGEQRDSVAYIQRAVDTYKTALQTFTRDHSPHIWEAISVALATALRSLGERYNPSSFAEAEAIYRDLLQRIDPTVTLIRWGAIARMS